MSPPPGTHGSVQVGPQIEHEILLRVESTSIRVTVGAARRLDVTGWARSRGCAESSSGVAAVDDGASAGAAESDDLELHALANNSATTRAPTIDESLRITALIVPQSRLAGWSNSLACFCLARTAGRPAGNAVGGVAHGSLRATG